MRYQETFLPILPRGIRRPSFSNKQTISWGENQVNSSDKLPTPYKLGSALLFPSLQVLKTLIMEFPIEAITSSSQSMRCAVFEVGIGSVNQTNSP